MQQRKNPSGADRSVLQPSSKKQRRQAVLKGAQRRDERRGDVKAKPQHGSLRGLSAEPSPEGFYFHFKLFLRQSFPQKNAA